MPQLSPATADSATSTVGGWSALVAQGWAWDKLLLSAVALLVATVVRRLLVRWINASISDPRQVYHWRKAVAYVVSAATLLFLITVWIEGLDQIGTFLGLLGAGIAIALRDLIADVAAWLFILWRQPFKVGDRIQCGEHAGDVVDISILQFTIVEIGNWVAAEQSTGRLIHIPNAKVLTTPLANYTEEFPFIWHEVPVLVTFESDWRLAKSLISDIVTEVASGTAEEARAALARRSGKVLISFGHVSPIVYTTVRGDGVLLTARFLAKARTRRGVEQALWEKILDAFAEHPQLDFAYRTQRIIRDDLGVAAAGTDVFEES